jgi:hypothetical protein
MGLEGSKVTAKSHTDAATIHAKAQAEATREARIAREKGTLGNLYQSAQTLVETARRDVDHARASSSEYVNARRMIGIEPRNDEERKLVAKAEAFIRNFDADQEKKLTGPMARVEALGKEMGMPALAAPTPTDIPTTMTRADVERTAKQYGKTVAEVEAAAKAKGITIR